LTSRLNLRPVSLWPLHAVRARLIRPRSCTCTEGRSTPRGRGHCNDFWSEHQILHLPRFDHRVAAEPEASGEARGATGGRSTQRGEKLQTRAAEVPRAPKCRPLVAAGSGLREVPSRRTGSEASGSFQPSPTGWPRTLIQRRTTRPHTTAHEERPNRRKPISPESDAMNCGALRRSAYAIDDTTAGRRRDPGPRRLRRSRVDANASTIDGSHALRHSSVSLHHCRSKPDSLPPQPRSR
jgi:hypothetical protein